MTTPTEPPRPPRDLPGIGAFLGLGMTVAVIIGLFVLLGLWVDSLLGSAPICLIVGIVLGCLAAAAAVVQMARQYL